MIHFAGLDVHRKSVRACICDQKGEILHEETFACDRPSLEKFAKERLTKDDSLALEATFNTWEIVSILSPFAGPGRGLNSDRLFESDRVFITAEGARLNRLLKGDLPVAGVCGFGSCRK